MRYVLLLLLFSSCSSRPLYSFNEIVIFKHYNIFYAKKCSTIGTILDVNKGFNGYVYTVGNVTCSKSKIDTTKVTLDIPESHILKVVL